MVRETNPWPPDLQSIALLTEQVPLHQLSLSNNLSSNTYWFKVFSLIFHYLTKLGAWLLAKLGMVLKVVSFMTAVNNHWSRLENNSQSRFGWLLQKLLQDSLLFCCIYFRFLSLNPKQNHTPQQTTPSYPPFWICSRKTSLCCLVDLGREQADWWKTQASSRLFQEGAQAHFPDSGWLLSLHKEWFDCNGMTMRFLFLFFFTYSLILTTIIMTWSWQKIIAHFQTVMTYFIKHYGAQISLFSHSKQFESLKCVTTVFKFHNYLQWFAWKTNQPWRVARVVFPIQILLIFSCHYNSYFWDILYSWNLWVN